MAKVKMPLMSVDASGAIADAVVAAKWKGRNYFRVHVKPSQPRTDAQVGVRASFAGLVELIKTETADVQAEWAEAAKALAVTWLNMFIRVNQKNLTDGLGLQQRPVVGPPEEYIYTPELSVTVEGRRVRFTISQHKLDDIAYAALLHVAKSSGFAPAWSNLKALVRAPGAGNSVVIELSFKPGTYYARCRMSSPNRVFSPSSAEVSFTVS